MDVEKAAFLVRSDDEVYESLRSAAGLGVENIEAGVFLLDAGIPSGVHEDDILELLEMIDDLEGRVFTTLAGDADRFEYVERLSAPDMAALIRDYDLMVAF